MSLILLAFCGLWVITAPIHFSHPQKSAVFTPQNCPHCGQKWSARRKKAPGFSPAFSPQRPKSSDFARFGVSHVCRISFFDRTRCAGLWSIFLFSRTAAQRPVFGLPVGTPLGCARKTGHSRNTRLTLVDGRFPAAPVGTLPSVFGFVPAHIPCPALQAFVRKTAGW